LEEEAKHLTRKRAIRGSGPFSTRFEPAVRDTSCIVGKPNYPETGFWELSLGNASILRNLLDELS